MRNGSARTIVPSASRETSKGSLKQHAGSHLAFDVSALYYSVTGGKGEKSKPTIRIVVSLDGKLCDFIAGALRPRGMRAKLTLEIHRDGWHASHFLSASCRHYGISLTVILIRVFQLPFYYFISNHFSYFTARAVYQSVTRRYHFFAQFDEMSILSFSFELTI